MVLALISTLLYQLGKYNSSFIEWYRRYLLVPVLARVYSRIMGIFPFSIAELLLIAVIPALVGLTVYFVIQLVRREKKKIFLLQALINTGVAVSLIYSVFLLFCGIYYNRMSIGKYLGYEVQESTTQELYQACMSLAEQANQLAEQVNYSMDFSELADETLQAYKNLGRQHKIFATVYGRPKQVLLSKYMSYTEIVGIFIPFTMEANVNTDVVAYNIPGNACHEMAHMYGFMREDEANYIAYLACMASERTEFQYSGVMHAFIACKNALFEDDRQLWQQVDEVLSPGVRRDLQENNEYWAKIEQSDAGKAVAQTATKVNDTYLKINGQSDGVKSYGRMVDFILAQYRSEESH